MNQQLDIKDKFKRTLPTLVFYFIASTCIFLLYLFGGQPKGAHVPSLHLFALIGLIFISAFLGFKNAMSSDKSSNLIVLIHLVALLTTILILST